MLFLATLAWSGGLAGRHAYEAAVATETRELRIYDGWYTALLVRGTRLSSDLLAAQSVRLAEITGAEASAAASPEGPSFVLTAAGQWKDELRFAGDGSTTWTVQLMAGSRVCAAPTAVERIKKPTELDRALYPHFSQWDTLVKLTWPAAACGEAEPTALRFSSARGNGELRWTE